VLASYHRPRGQQTHRERRRASIRTAETLTLRGLQRFVPWPFGITRIADAASRKSRMRALHAAPGGLLRACMRLSARFPAPFLLTAFPLGSKTGRYLFKVKGNTLYTVTPDTALHDAVNTMAEHDIGSLVVMEYGDLVGMLTFREIIMTLRTNGGSVGTTTIRKVMDDHPITCTPETEVDEVRRMMLEHHVRYLPVMESRSLMGVISFYDVAKAVVEAQGFENKLLKAYIRDWPEEERHSAT
jgi:CBS domain-containing protein